MRLKGRCTIVELMNMPLEYINMIYKIISDRAKKEAKEQEEEDKRAQEEAERERRLQERNDRGNRIQQQIRPPMRITQAQAAQFEDELEDMV